MDFRIPNEWLELCKVVRTFCEREVDTRWREIEETDTVPPILLEGAARLGLFGLAVPAAYGGLALPMLARALVYQELGRTHAGFATIIGAHCGIGTTTLIRLGSDQQKQRYLPSIATGETITAFALTEPGAGSDAANLAVTATPDGADWVLSGTKHFITNSQIAQIFTVFAVTDNARMPKGISAFIVERGTPGFTVSKVQPTMGLRGSHVAELTFDHCVLQADSLLGDLDSGYRTALSTLSEGRVSVAARCVGASERVTELAISYSRQREQFGQQLSSFQLIQAYLAEMAAETSAARALTYQAAWMIDQGLPSRRESAMAKLISTETYGRVVDKSLQIHGGMGYCKEMEIEHFYRDARITRIYEGTSEIQKLVIAREMLSG